MFKAKPGHALTSKERDLILSKAHSNNFNKKEKAALAAIATRWGSWPGGRRSSYKSIVEVARQNLFMFGQAPAREVLQMMSAYAWSAPNLVSATCRSIDTANTSIDADDMEASLLRIEETCKSRIIEILKAVPCIEFTDEDDDVVIPNPIVGDTKAVRLSIELAVYPAESYKIVATNKAGENLSGWGCAMSVNGWVRLLKQLEQKANS